LKAAGCWWDTTWVAFGTIASRLPGMHRTMASLIEEKIRKVWFTADDKCWDLHATKLGAGSFGKGHGERERQRPRIVQEHLTKRVRILLEGARPLVAHQVDQQLRALRRIPGLQGR
jgi:hypothetical protein